MYKQLLLVFALFFGLAAPVVAQEMLDLPVNPKTTSLTYLYCLTDDRPAVTDLLIQRYRYIGETEKNAKARAEEWVGNGYCHDFLSALDEKAPRMREIVTAKLREAGFNTDTPISEQAATSSKEKKGKLGKVLKDIGNFLARLLTGGGGSVDTAKSYLITTTTTLPDGTSTTVTDSCDKSTTITIGGGGGSGFEPTPFYPDPPK